MPVGFRGRATVDTLFITDLRIDTVIGVFEWERHVRQTVVLDIEMGTDCRVPAASDDVADALDYKAVAKRLIDFVGGSEYQLVETLAERCADLLLAEFSVPWLRLRLNKQGALRGARDVGIVIERRAAKA